MTTSSHRILPIRTKLPPNFCFLLVSSVATSSQLKCPYKYGHFRWIYIKNFAITGRNSIVQNLIGFAK